MPFDNKTNHNRVAKIIDILDLIEASRISNKASVEEMNEIIKPLVERLGVEATPAVEEPTVSKTPHMPPHAWTTIRQCAQKAKPKDLMTALAIVTTRIDEYIYDLEQEVKK